VSAGILPVAFHSDVFYQYLSPSNPEQPPLRPPRPAISGSTSSTTQRVQLSLRSNPNWRLPIANGSSPTTVLSSLLFLPSPTCQLNGSLMTCW
jgi:hypothetical protein